MVISSLVSGLYKYCTFIWNAPYLHFASTNWNNNISIESTDFLQTPSTAPTEINSVDTVVISTNEGALDRSTPSGLKVAIPSFGGCSRLGIGRRR